MAPKPSVLIFGGLNTCSRPLAAYLVPPEGEALVSHLRIVDKFSVHPPTTYIGSEFPKVLARPEVEYKQANLTVEATIPALFDPPEGQAPYEYVFDLTGEIRQDRTEMIQINSTCYIARNIGLEAAKRKVKAYVRLQHPFYETSSKGAHDESVDIEPSGTIGTWWHETLRMLAAIDGLNLVIARAGFVYGPYTDFGIFAPALAVASVYGYMKKPMKSMWSPGKQPEHTLHVYDLAGGLWALAEWMAPLGRAEADKLAGEKIPFHNDKKKIQEVKGMPDREANLVAPLFNLVDDSNNTLLAGCTKLTSYFGTTFEFFDVVTSTIFKLKDDIVEDINEHHVSGWVEMLQKSDPPISNSPVSAYMDSYLLSKRVYAADNSKLKRLTGYQLKVPQGWSPEIITEIIDKWKAEGSWPNL